MEVKKTGSTKNNNNLVAASRRFWSGPAEGAVGYHGYTVGASSQVQNHHQPQALNVSVNATDPDGPWETESFHGQNHNAARTRGSSVNGGDGSEERWRKGGERH